MIFNSSSIRLQFVFFQTLTIGLASRVAAHAPASESVTAHELIDQSGRERTLMDQYEYVMFGKVFKLEEKSSERR